MKENIINFFRGILQIGVAIVIDVIFILIAKFALRGYFYDNAYPVLMDYAQWADEFVSYVVTLSIVSIILTVLFVLMAAFVKGPFLKAGGWVLELFISIILGVICAVLFAKNAPEESNCITIANIMFILETTIAFFISSFFGDSYYKYEYNPILMFFNKRK